mgnify:CR=1 FL=1
MFIGTLVFNLIPGQMLRVFTSDPQVITIGMVGFHFVGISFIPMVTSLIFPVFFQAVGAAVKSSLLTVVRTVVLFVPLGYLFSRLGLNDFWFTFPVTARWSGCSFTGDLWHNRSEKTFGTRQELPNSLQWN